MAAADRFVYERRVCFSDTDMAGIVHFASFFRYLEEAEHALLRSLGVPLIHRDGPEAVSFPRLKVSCEYRRPARFEDLLRIGVSVSRLASKTVTYRFAVDRAEDRLADGEFVVIACRFAADGSLRSVALPESFREAITPHLVPEQSD